MISRFSTKFVLCLILISLIIPSGLLFYPKKAEAIGGDCIAQIAGFFGAKKFMEKVVGVVPTSDNIVGLSSVGSFAQDCIIKPLVTQLAKAMLYNITVSTVEWINSGFEGNPGFAQDLNGLFTDSADQVLGEFIQREAAFLCSPFSFQVRIAVAQSFLPFRRRAACTLSEVSRNIENFIDNNGYIGWDRWLEMTTVPQNNAYGAFAIYQDEVSKRIVDAKYVEKTYLDWGRGFKDWQVCETDEEVIDKLNRESAGKVLTFDHNLEENTLTGRTGGYKTSYTKSEIDASRKCERKTPGAIVESRLSATLNKDLEQLAIADNLNAIYDALTNQFMKQIIGGTVGLLGGRKTSSGSYGSVNYGSATISSQRDPALEAAINESFTQTQAELAPFFDEPDAIIIDEENDSEEQSGTVETTRENTMEWSVIKTTPILTGTFEYEINLVSNYSVRELGVKTTLKKDGVAIPFQNIFSSLQTTFGRTDGSYATRNINLATDANIAWEGVSVGQDSTFVFRFLGQKKIGVIAGTYVFETILSKEDGTVIRTQTSSFTVQ